MANNKDDNPIIINKDNTIHYGADGRTQKEDKGTVSIVNDGNARKQYVGSGAKPRETSLANGGTVALANENDTSTSNNSSGSNSNSGTQTSSSNNVALTEEANKTSGIDSGGGGSDSGNIELSDEAKATAAFLASVRKSGKKMTDAIDQAIASVKNQTVNLDTSGTVRRDQDKTKQVNVASSNFLEGSSDDSSARQPRTKNLGTATEYPTTTGPMYVIPTKKRDKDPYRRDGGYIVDETPYGLITPSDHFAPDPDNPKSGIKIKPNENHPPYTANYFFNKEDHFTRDWNQGLEGEENVGIGGGTQFSNFRTVSMINEEAPVERMGETNVNYDPSPVAVFSGSTTDVNPHNDPTTEAIIESGTLSRYLEETNQEKELGSNILMPPVSPLHPFTRMNSIKTPDLANRTIFTAYNRTRTPIADVAWRKGFRYIFFTRPECYLWYRTPDTNGICDQARNDEDFSSAFTRMPHIVQMLSPWYISGSIPKTQQYSNWNLLLSNLVQGLNVGGTTLNISENITKSLEGYTITPGGMLEGRQGSSIDLTFKDTRFLEVYELLRLWQLYIYKRKKGIFVPPFNGYAKTNGFLDIGEDPVPLSGPNYWQYHPYDRALEYCASLYDIVTDETGTRIMYWCKYYGIYPTSVQPSLNNEANAPITDINVTASFKYHYKLENSNKTFVEFNHDAGLVNEIGTVQTEVVADSQSFLLKNVHDDPAMKKYIGAAGMFTGSPYVIMEKGRANPVLQDAASIVIPQLRFMNILDIKQDARINLGIENDHIDQSNKNIVSYSDYTEGA